jgi:hypothetical protein
MNILKALKCLLAGGHNFARSNYYPGKMTCVRCHVRRKRDTSQNRISREVAVGRFGKPSSGRM